jgi:hypothetical protein
MYFGESNGYGNEGKIQIDENYTREIIERPKNEKETLDTIFAGKKIDEVLEILKDKKSEAYKLLAQSSDVDSYVVIIEEVSREMRSKGMFTKDIQSMIRRLPDQNDLRFMVYEAAARTMLEMGFENFNTLGEILTALNQLKDYLHADEAVELNLDTWIKATKNLINDKKEGKSAGDVASTLKFLTRKYDLRSAAERCFESAVGV